MTGRILIVEGGAAVGESTGCSGLVRAIAARPRVPNRFSFRHSFTPLFLGYAATPPPEEAVRRHLSGTPHLKTNLLAGSKVDFRHGR